MKQESVDQKKANNKSALASRPAGECGFRFIELLAGFRWLLGLGSDFDVDGFCSE